MGECQETAVLIGVVISEEVRRKGKMRLCGLRALIGQVMGLKYV